MSSTGKDLRSTTTPKLTSEPAVVSWTVAEYTRILKLQKQRNILHTALQIVLAPAHLGKFSLLPNLTDINVGRPKQTAVYSSALERSAEFTEPGSF